MSETVLDSSVLLAIFKSEHFEEEVLGVMEGAVISAVNLAEIWTNLHDLKLLESTSLNAVLSLLDRIEPFTASQARLAADLRPKTRHIGLSLGDRACLALGIELAADVYTADHAWSLVDVGLKIHLIR